jgi:hypothetical protein
MSAFRTSVKELKAEKIVGHIQFSGSIVAPPLAAINQEIISSAGANSIDISDIAAKNGMVWKVSLGAGNIALTVNAANVKVDRDVQGFMWLYVTGGDGAKTLTLTNGTDVANLGQVLTPATGVTYLVPMLFQVAQATSVVTFSVNSLLWVS